MQFVEAYKDLKDVFFQETHIYPALGTGATLTDGGAPYVLGNWVAVIPANAIANNFYIVGVFAGNYSNPVEGQVRLAYGPNDIELANLKNKVIAGALMLLPSSFTFGPIPANSQIRACYATFGGAGDTIDIALQYKLRI